MELCKASYILCFLKNLFPPVTGLFLQFIFLDKCLSGEYISSSWVIVEEERKVTHLIRIDLERRKNTVVSHGKN